MQDKIMNATSSLDGKNFARNIRNFNRRSWETATKDIYRPGLLAKFTQNSDLLQLLVEKTGKKTIVECANDRLWGTGIPLAREGCLDKEKWISGGILGELLMEIRDGKPVSLSNRSKVSNEPSLPGVTSNMPVEATLTSKSTEVPSDQLGASAAGASENTDAIPSEETVPTSSSVHGAEGIMETS